MIRINKRLKEGSQLSQTIPKEEERVTSMEKTLQTLVEGTIHTNKLLQQLLDTPTVTQTLDYNKKGEKMSTVHKPQIQDSSVVTVVCPSSSSLNTNE